LLEEKDVVFAALDEGKPVGQNFIGCGHFFAEQGFPRSRQAVFFNLSYHLKYVLACLAENIPPVRLEFSQPRFHHVRLLGVIKMHAAIADPFLRFQQEICELRGDLLGKEFQHRDTHQQIDFNVLPDLARCSPACSRSERWRFQAPVSGGRAALRSGFLRSDCERKTRLAF